jgi:HTH-type transcriptional regulator / antitoxin MqsA
MFKCHVCGSEDSRPEHINEIFNIDGTFHLVEKIPTTVCCRCQEEIFSSETMEQIREMLHGKAQPVRSISVNVFAYDAAV